MNLRSAFALTLMIALASCATKQKDNDPYETRGGSFWDIFSGPTTYQSHFNDRTVEARSHAEFEPVLTAFITHWNTPLRQAYINEMTSQFRLPTSQAKILATEQADEDKKYITFILSAATREPTWTDFSKKNSMWRITLENEDSSIQIDPESILLISYRDEVLKYFYRHMNSFTSTYKVRFPREAAAGLSQVYFHISGPRGALVAKFTVDAKSSDR